MVKALLGKVANPLQIAIKFAETFAILLDPTSAATTNIRLSGVTINRQCVQLRTQNFVRLTRESMTISPSDESQQC